MHAIEKFSSHTQWIYRISRYSRHITKAFLYKKNIHSTHGLTLYGATTTNSNWNKWKALDNWLILVKASRSCWKFLFPFPLELPISRLHCDALYTFETYFCCDRGQRTKFIKVNGIGMKKKVHKNQSANVSI